MSSAVIRIDLPGNLGTDGVARNDGIPNTQVTLRSTGTGSTHEMRFFDVTNPGIIGLTQIDTITPTAVNNTDYTVTINGIVFLYHSDSSATATEIVSSGTGNLKALINADPTISALLIATGTAVLTLTALAPGTTFVTVVNGNQALVRTQNNRDTSTVSAPAVPVLLPVGDGLSWTFTPPGGATGYGQSFGIELLVDRGLPSEARSRHKYAIPTQVHGYIYPLFAEGADPQASLQNHGSLQVALSCDNVAGNYRGFHPRLLQMFVDLEKVVSGTATIAIGNASVAVTLPAALNGKPVSALIMQAADDATLTSIRRTSWNGSGVLTIAGNANATAAVTVAYSVDGR